MNSHETFNHCTQEEMNIKLSNACYDGNLEQTKFLLTSHILAKKADIGYNDNEPLQYAISNGHLHLVDYLLKSNELKQNADIHACEDIGFKYAVFKKKLDILQYFIFDFEINKTTAIESILSEPLNSSIPLDETTVEQVKRMFEMRDLKKSLNSDLNSNNVNKQKAKI